jgi:hypothetical protein
MQSSEDTVIDNLVEIVVGRTYFTTDGLTAKIESSTVGLDGCRYYVGYVSDWPKPVVWDDRGKELYLYHTNLILLPVEEQPKSYWMVRPTIGASSSKHMVMFLTRQEADEYVVGCEHIYTIIKLEEVK